MLMGIRFFNLFNPRLKLGSIDDEMFGKPSRLPVNLERFHRVEECGDARMMIVHLRTTFTPT